MPPDGAMVEETRSWFVEAATDIRAAEVMFRYPWDASQPSREEAESGITLAREVYDAILNRTPHEVRP